MLLATFTLGLLLLGLSRAYPQYSAGNEETGVTSTQCSSYEVCVPDFQCINGTINTSGIGLIDIRIRPRPKKCTNEDYDKIDSICCIKPDVSPLLECPSGQECLLENQCNPDGSANTDGAGSIDVRFLKYCYTSEQSAIGVCCTPPPNVIDTCPGPSVCQPENLCKDQQILDNSNGYQPHNSQAIWTQCRLSGQYEEGKGVCCKPIAPIVDTCPGPSVCQPENLCVDQHILDHSDRYQPYGIPAVWTQCSLGNDYGVVEGVCCKPIATIIDTCPGPSVCQPENLCIDQHILDHSKSYHPYGTQVVWAQCSLGSEFGPGKGVCCKPIAPITDHCPGPSVCQPEDLCIDKYALDHSNDYQPYSSQAVWTQCPLTSQYGAGKGVCCGPPPLVADSCPGPSICLPENLCINQHILDHSDGYQPYGSQVIWKQCHFTGDYAVGKGVCCRPTAPIIDTCPGLSNCLPEILCQNQEILDHINGYQLYDSQAIWAQCPLPGGSQEKGVCCRSPPAPVVDKCPGSSVCLPDILCSGRILDDSDEYQPYNTQATWTQCPLGGGPENLGICCQTSPPFTTGDKCGVRNQDDGLDLKILNDKEALFGEFPWQAILFFTNYTFKCGASLVTDKHLLTGAHCVHGYKYSDFRVRLGEWTVNSYDEPFGYEDVEIASITIHPNYNNANLHNDIAIIELQYPVEFNFHINTVCLPEPPPNYLQPGTRCFASGWGKNAFEGNFQVTLKKVDLPYVEHDKCQNLLRKTRLGNYFELDDSFICAGGEEYKDTCTGDGGGPLVCEDPLTGAYALWGITAWGINCGQKDVPGVYVNVQYFHDWIIQNLYGVNPSYNYYGK